MRIDAPSPLRERAIHIPPATGLVLLSIIAIHVARLVLPSFDAWSVTRGVLVPAQLCADPAQFYRLLSYALLHGNALHLGVNSLSLLAFGSGVERKWGWHWLLGLLVLGALAGAALHVAIFSDSNEPVVGLSAGICALFGAYLPQLAPNAMQRARLIGIMLLGTIVLGFIGLPNRPELVVAWQAHLGGMLAGLVAGFYLLHRRMRADG